MELNINLKTQTSYTWYLNYFSKWLIIKDNLKEHKNIIIICENTKNINEYKKVFKFLNINSCTLENRNDLTNLVNNYESLILINNETIDQDIIDKNFLDSENIYIYIYDSKYLLKILLIS